MLCEYHAQFGELVFSSEPVLDVGRWAWGKDPFQGARGFHVTEYGKATASYLRALQGRDAICPGRVGFKGSAPGCRVPYKEQAKWGDQDAPPRPGV